MKNGVSGLLLLALAFATGEGASFAGTKSYLPSGRYYINSKNIEGPEFAEFDYFEIRLRNNKYTGRLFAKTNGGYAALPMKTIVVRGERLRFKTTTVNGVWFSFDGQLIKHRQNGWPISCEVILRGKLKEVDKQEGDTENELTFKYAPLTQKGSC